MRDYSLHSLDFFFLKKFKHFLRSTRPLFSHFLILLAAKGASPSKILNSNVHSSRPRISLERVEISSELVARTRGGLKLDVKKKKKKRGCQKERSAESVKSPKAMNGRMQGGKGVHTVLQGNTARATQNGSEGTILAKIEGIFIFIIPSANPSPPLVLNSGGAEKYIYTAVSSANVKEFSHPFTTNAAILLR